MKTTLVTKINKHDKEYLVRTIIRGIFESTEFKPKEAIRILKELVSTGEEASGY